MLLLKDQSLHLAILFLASSDSQIDFDSNIVSGSVTSVSLAIKYNPGFSTFVSGPYLLYCDQPSPGVSLA